MARNSEFIDLAVRSRILTPEDARKLSLKFDDDAMALLLHLASGAVAKKSRLGRLWGDSIGISWVDLDKTLFDHQVVKKLPERFARDNRMIPLYQFGDAVTVAMADPAQTSVLKEAGMIMGLPVSPVFAFPEDIADAIDIEYQTSTALSELMDKAAMSALFKGAGKITEEQMRKLSGEQAVVEFVRGLLLLAVKERASDIHIEPEEAVIRIRFRIDGVLQERLRLESTLLLPIVSRLKIMSNLNIAERRRPQDGRVNLTLTHKSIDYRFSTVPTIHGEKSVLRVLGSIRQRDIPTLSELGLSATTLGNLKRIIDSPNGVFFVTGPTGSGKTTTLFSVLQHLNKPGVNIMTIEDPVEYRLEGSNQIQVNHAIELDFGSALRSFLRQDPDIILVGEIRDMETARIASQAALTGHLVLTTMHTNNALQAVTRLVEIGVEPFLVAPAIIGVMAQRLVRCICTHCREKYALSAEETGNYFEWDGKTPVHFYRGAGCEHCNQTGYSGRIAIHELFIMNSEIRRLVSRGASILEIQERARAAGFQSMRYDGMKKVLRGLTTIEEINKATVAEE